MSRHYRDIICASWHIKSLAIWLFVQHLAQSDNKHHIKVQHYAPFNSLTSGKFEWNFRHVIFKQNLVIDGWGICCEIALIWMSLDFTDDQSSLVQVMAWCHQATSHYLSPCWPRSLSPFGVTRPQWVNSQIWSPTDSPHQVPLMKKVFPSHNLIMCPTHWEVVLESWVCSDPSKRIQESFITLDWCQKVWFVQSPLIKTKKITDLTYRSGNKVILMKFSSLAALKVVILTTFSAASNENFIKMMLFLFSVGLHGLII